MRPEGLFYSDVVKFAEQIERYFEVFGRDRVRVIIFDDFKANTAKVYQQTLEFLGVSSNFRPNFTKMNANKRVRSAALQRFLRFPPSCLDRLGRSVPLCPKFKEAWWSQFSQTARACNTYAAPRPPLDPELHRSLQRKFAPEVERLSDLLQRDLTYWSREIPIKPEPTPSALPRLTSSLWQDWMHEPLFAYLNREYL